MLGVPQEGRLVLAGSGSSVANDLSQSKKQAGTAMDRVADLNTNMIDSLPMATFSLQEDQHVGVADGEVDPFTSSVSLLPVVVAGAQEDYHRTLVRFLEPVRPSQEDRSVLCLAVSWASSRRFRKDRLALLLLERLWRLMLVALVKVLGALWLMLLEQKLYGGTGRGIIERR